MTQVQLDPVAQAAKSWPFQEARSLLAHIESKGKKPGDMVTFETGFGPSGAPHIGTFGEVVRTQMVRHAFEQLTLGAFPTRLLVVSDDYDGFRKIPDGLPESMKEDLNLPLCHVRDPFGEYSNFALRNNTLLVNFVNELSIDWKFDYEFVSATEMYESGRYNETLSKVYENHDAILQIMLPTLGVERQESYCAFMPISLHSGHVIQHGVKLAGANTLIYDDDGHAILHDIRNGHSKLQWKVDWAARWVTFDVDYEMSGKDLIDSVKVSTKICKVLGGVPPLNMTYELFCDEEGKKISKSKGNGVTMEEWFRYGSREALAMFMFQNPRASKNLFIDVIPRVSDDLIKNLISYRDQTGAQHYDNPVWHIYGGRPPMYDGDATYGLMVNLASVSGAREVETLWRYLGQYRDFTEINGMTQKIMREMAGHVIEYVAARVLPNKTLRAPTEREARAFRDLALRLLELEDGLDAESYQYHVYEVGKEYQFDPLRAWFQAIYEVIFGDSQGPRFGTFIAAYGREPTIALLEEAAARATV